MRRVPIQQHPPSPAVRVDAFAVARLSLPVDCPERCGAGQKPGMRGRRGGQAQDPREMYLSVLLDVQRERCTQPKYVSLAEGSRRHWVARFW